MSFWARPQLFLEWARRWWLDEEPADVPGHGGHGVLGQREVDGEGEGEEGGGEEGGGWSSSWKGGFFLKEIIFYGEYLAGRGGRAGWSRRLRFLTLNMRMITNQVILIIWGWPYDHMIIWGWSYEDDKKPSNPDTMMLSDSIDVLIITKLNVMRTIQSVFWWIWSWSLFQDWWWW